MMSSPGSRSQTGAPAPRLIAIKQATFMLGIGRTLIYELIAQRRLTTVRIGRRRFVPMEAIETFLSSLSA